MTRQKIYVDEKIDGWNFQKLYDRVGQIISENPELTWDKITIESTSEYDSLYATLDYLRDETDKEQEQRLDYENRIKNSRRRQYEELKKEFGE